MKKAYIVTHEKDKSGMNLRFTRRYWRWALEQIPAQELVGGRASTKSMYYKRHTPPKKDEKRKKKDELVWLWFEEA